MVSTATPLLLQPITLLCSPRYPSLSDDIYNPPPPTDELQEINASSAKFAFSAGAGMLVSKSTSVGKAYNAKKPASKVVLSTPLESDTFDNEPSSWLTLDKLLILESSFNETLVRLV